MGKLRDLGTPAREFSRRDFLTRGGGLLLGSVAAFQGGKALVQTASAASTSASSVVDVTKFGATGDGKTDDLAAIKKAVAALGDGETLLFPAGTYFVTDTVFVTGRRNITIEGAGATISCSANTDSSRVLAVQSCTAPTVQNITLQHSVAGVRKNDADGLGILFCTDAVVQGVNILMVYSIGIRVAGSTRVIVRNCSVNGNLADGIGIYGFVRDTSAGDASISSGSSTLTCASAVFCGADIGATVAIDGAGAGGSRLVTKILAVSSSSEAVLATPAAVGIQNYNIKIARQSDHVLVAGNTLEATGDDSLSSVGYGTLGGLEVDANADILMTDNKVHDSRARGIVYVGTKRGIVRNNSVDTAHHGGVFVSTEPNVGKSHGCNDIEVFSNTFTNCNTSYPESNYGSIYVNSSFSDLPVDNVRILNNTVNGGGSYYVGIGSSNGDHATRNIEIRNNTFTGGNGANPGINITNATGVIITCNRIDDSAASAISVDGSVTGSVELTSNTINGYAKKMPGAEAISSSYAGAKISDNKVKA